jgi:hypothetical protein
MLENEVKPSVVETIGNIKRSQPEHENTLSDSWLVAKAREGSPPAPIVLVARFAILEIAPLMTARSFRQHVRYY